MELGDMRYKHLPNDGDDTVEERVDFDTETKSFWRSRKGALTVAGLILVGMAMTASSSCARRFFGFGRKHGANELDGLDFESKEWASCARLFDGCNNCFRTSPGGPLGCTEMACSHYREPRCEEWLEPMDVTLEVVPEPVPVSKQKHRPGLFKKGDPGLKIDNVKQEDYSKCKRFFDGCNNCFRTAPGGSLGCTRMACSKYEKPFCKEWFPAFEQEKPVVQQKKPQVKVDTVKQDDFSNCKFYFDGCNNCHRGSPGGPLACTRRACFEQKEHFCKEWFPVSDHETTTAAAAVTQEEPSGPPPGCSVWFDGCNKCRVAGSELVCTKMFCPPDAYSKAECLEYYKD